MAKFNVQSAVNHLVQHSLSSSIHKCATYVENAIAAGGVPRPNCTEGGGNGYAESLHYKGTMKKHGWNLIEQGKFTNSSKSPSNHQPGDVCIMSIGYGKTKSNHIAMYSGQQWISDFRQNNCCVYGGNSFKYYYWVYRHSSISGNVNVITPSYPSGDGGSSAGGSTSNTEEYTPPTPLPTLSKEEFDANVKVFKQPSTIFQDYQGNDPAMYEDAVKAFNASGGNWSDSLLKKSMTPSFSQEDLTRKTEELIASGLSKEEAAAQAKDSLMKMAQSNMPSISSADNYINAPDKALQSLTSISVPHISASEFTGMADSVLQQMLDTAFTFLDMVMLPINVFQQGLDIASQAADITYSAAQTTYMVVSVFKRAKLPTGQDAEKALKMMELAEDMKRGISNFKIKVGKISMQVSTYIDEIKQLAQSAKDYSMQWIEDKINWVLGKITEYVSIAMNWVQSKLDKLKQKIQEKIESAQKKAEEKIEAAVQQMVEKRIEHEKNQAIQKQQAEQAVANAPTNPAQPAPDLVKPA